MQHLVHKAAHGIVVHAVTDDIKACQISAQHKAGVCTVQDLSLIHILTNTQMWDQDLTKIEGLEAAVLADLEMIRTQGAEAAYKSCL